MAASQFMVTFKENLEKLDQIHNTIITQMKEKNAFVGRVSAELVAIKDRLAVLGQKIAQLRQRVTELEGNIQNNSNDAKASEETIAQLRQENQQLIDERTRMQQEMQVMTNQQLQTQNKINDLEGQLRNLQAENEALNQQIQGHPDQAQQSIKEALERQQQENQQQMQALADQIADKDRQIGEAQQEIENLRQQISEHGNTINGNQKAVQEMQQRIAELTSQNDEMKKEIENANNVINTAIGEINQLLNDPQYTQNVQGVEQLLREITEHIKNIEDSLGGQGKGTGMLSGLFGGPQQEQQQQQQATGPGRPFIQQNLNTQLQINGEQINLDFFIKSLNKKVKEVSRNIGPDNKYSKLLRDVYNASSIEELQNLINDNSNLFGNYSLQNPVIRGGVMSKYIKTNKTKNKNKTKKQNKNKKSKKIQKGGFKYNTKTKRTSTYSATSFSRKNTPGSKK